MKLSLDTEIIRPGLYSVNRAWKNEMGYWWNLNEHLIVHYQDAPTHCTCSLPEGVNLRLHFHMSADRIRSNFAYIGPFTSQPGHY